MLAITASKFSDSIKLISRMGKACLRRAFRAGTTRWYALAYVCLRTAFCDM